VIIVGGTYREICREPAIDYLYGSGLRLPLLFREDVSNLNL